ncbi:hypothetical protein CAPTEDRAFT_177574 [Capitella teleta]|uniref:Uncharacterized protein n=1 Tax=Capitella teleta TaxID=283909 RepID=R7UH27_CAPTE|nr:hypothetical protein CAPTEDRAFT_177574 [Capitella teleta]|eukprot:ELU05398.1 hypothetical protein CAPTEDRAFT_177574 [Capitella teleta]
MGTSYDVIRWHLDHLSLKHRGKVALVVPAFEAMPADPLNKHPDSPASAAKTYSYPENKTVLLAQERHGLVEPFHIHFFPAAHMPTNFTKWRTASIPYRIHYGPYFEPYVVVSVAAIPPYVEEFLGRQMNKVTHIRALHSKHFQFWVLPDVYTVHLPHEVERSPQDYWRCVNSIANLVMLKIQEAEEKSNNTHDVIPHIYKRGSDVRRGTESSEKEDAELQR